MSDHQKYRYQKLLRAAALEAIRSRGYDARPIKGTGGARVALSVGGNEGTAFVRTTADRWIVWMRDDVTGEFKGFGEPAKIVVVAALDDQGGATKGGVFAVAPADVHKAFHDNLAARMTSNPSLARHAPVSVCLDRMERGGVTDTGSGLKEKAIWTAILPLPSTEPDEEAAAAPDSFEHAVAERDAEEPIRETKEGFAARVRQEFAELMGVSVDKVRIEFHVAL